MKPHFYLYHILNLLNPVQHFLAFVDRLEKITVDLLGGAGLHPVAFLRPTSFGHVSPHPMNGFNDLSREGFGDSGVLLREASRLSALEVNGAEDIPSVDHGDA